MADYVGDWAGGHAVRSRLTGATTEVRVRRRIVDGTYLDVKVPATHTPSFTVDSEARFIPVGRLVDVAEPTETYTAARYAADASAAIRQIGARGRIPIVVGGTGFLSDFAVVRYDADGSLDPSFGTAGKLTTAIVSGSEMAYAVALQSDGKIVVAGDTFQDDGSSSSQSGAGYPKHQEACQGGGHNRRPEKHARRFAIGVVEPPFLRTCAGRTQADAVFRADIRGTHCASRSAMPLRPESPRANSTVWSFATTSNPT